MKAIHLQKINKIKQAEKSPELQNIISKSRKNNQKIDTITIKTSK